MFACVRKITLAEIMLIIISEQLQVQRCRAERREHKNGNQQKIQIKPKQNMDENIELLLLKGIMDQKRCKKYKNQ